MRSMIELNGVSKSYGTGATRVPAIGNVSFSLPPESSCRSSDLRLRASRTILT